MGEVGVRTPVPRNWPGLEEPGLCRASSRAS
jgi:hypothetical protein